MTTLLESLRTSADFYRSRLQAAQKSHDADAHYCSSCFASADPQLALQPSVCCHETVVCRAVAISNLKDLIATYTEDIQKILKAEPVTNPVPADPKPSAEPATTDVEVTIIIGIQKAGTFTTAKRARHYLRDNGRTVHDARKVNYADGKGQIWFFD